MSHRGASQYSDSPMYISEELQKRHGSKYKIIWFVDNPSRFLHLKDKDIRIVKYKSLRAIYEMNTAKVCVTNCGFFPALIKRKKQLRINTLHGGGAYKANTIRKSDTGGVICARKLQKARISLYNLVLSGCRLSSELNIRKDLCYNGEILECGMPRNDIFFRHDESLINKVKSFYNLNDEKILLVAPTWREDNNSRNIELDYRQLKNELELKYGGYWKVMLRTHHLSKVDTGKIERGNLDFLINATQYPNIQELLLSADMLITDYSSLLWDNCVQEKPAILFTPDLEQYSSERGFIVPVEEWELPYAENMDELVEIIHNYNFEDLKKCARKHTEKFGSYEKGKATQIVADRIDSFVKGY